MPATRSFRTLQRERIRLRELSWMVFTLTGDIEAYMLYREEVTESNLEDEFPDLDDNALMSH